MPNSATFRRSTTCNEKFSGYRPWGRHASPAVSSRLGWDSPTDWAARAVADDLERDGRRQSADPRSRRRWTTGALLADCPEAPWRWLPLHSVMGSGSPSRTCHTGRRRLTPLTPGFLESAELWHAPLSRDGVSAGPGVSAGRLQHLIEIGVVTEVGVPLATGAKRAFVIALKFPDP